MFMKDIFKKCNSDKEKKILGKFMSMILCLQKHEKLRKIYGKGE